MSLKLMYITNQPQIAQIAESSGVDRIFVDMEYIGKATRQGGMDTVQSRHTVEDVERLRGIVKHSEILVRVNPIHEESDEFSSSENEIDAVIAAGADIIMLPFFKSVAEVERFVCAVGGKAKTMALLETPEAVACVDEILDIEGLDEIFVGLNDLSLGYGKKFMFEVLVDGTMERLCEKFRQAGIPYGFGGIAAPGKGALPSERIIREHYRLGSGCVILSRSFCNTALISDVDESRHVFMNGVAAIREEEAQCQRHMAFFVENKIEVEKAVRNIVGN